MNLLRKLLNIQTLKLIVINPDMVNLDTLKGLEGFPVHFIFSHKDGDIKVLDTGIVVKK